MKKILSIDCDGVLAATAEALLQYYDYTIYGVSLTIDDIDNHSFSRISSLDITIEQARALWMDFFAQIDHTAILPEHGAQDILQQLHADGWKLVVTTGRWDEIKEHTLTWIQHWYGALFDDIIFVHTAAPFISKGAACQHVGAFIHIDDHVDYARDTHDAGITTLLVDKPWNRHESIEQYPRMHRVHTRDDIYTAIQTYGV